MADREMNPQEWANMLSKHQDAFANAESFNNWMPPVGTYTALVSKPVQKGQLKNGKNAGLPYWKLTFQLLDGIEQETGQSLEGQEFQVMMSMGVPGILKETASKLHGTPVNDIALANAALEAATGKVVKVEIKLAKDGIHRNANILELVETTPQPQQAAPPTPAPTA